MRSKQSNSTTTQDDSAETPQQPDEIVNSLLHPLAREIRPLLTRSGRVEQGRILIDDEENILEAIRAGVQIVSVFHVGEDVSPQLRRALPADASVHEVAWRTCKKLFGNDKASRIFAIAPTPPLRGLQALTQGTQDIVVLEDVGISGNVGAIIRTSLALGAGGVVLLNYDPDDVYERRLIRASRGYVFAIPVVTASTAELLAACREGMFGLMVTDPHGSTAVTEIATLPERLAIAFGSEKRGCSDALVEAATFQVRISMNKHVESLNVSAAASIILHNRSRFNGITDEDGMGEK